MTGYCGPRGITLALGYFAFSLTFLSSESLARKDAPSRKVLKKNTEGKSMSTRSLYATDMADIAA